MHVFIDVYIDVRVDARACTCISRAFTAEAIQDDKLVKVHIPDDSNNANAVAKA
jgi:hypothetical protein